eukprot:COSAG04_NODE_1333_length_7187_cov_15.018764_3_plen_725_part_00
MQRTVTTVSGERSDSLQARARGSDHTIHVKIYSGGEARLSAGRSAEYVGGDVKAALVPQDCTYFELMHYLIEEKGYGPCSIRYENEGELISIQSQEDLDCALYTVSSKGPSLRTVSRGAALRLFLDQADEGQEALFLDDDDGISQIDSSELEEMEEALIFGPIEQGVLGFAQTDHLGNRTTSPEGERALWELTYELMADEARERAEARQEVRRGVLQSTEPALGTSPGYESQMEEVLNAIDQAASIGPSPGPQTQPAAEQPKPVKPVTLRQNPTAAAVEAAKRRPSPRKPIFLHKPDQSVLVERMAQPSGEPEPELEPEQPAEAQQKPKVGGTEKASEQQSASAASSLSSVTAPAEPDDSNSESAEEEEEDTEEAAPVATIAATELSNLRYVDRGGYGQIFVAMWREMHVAVKAMPMQATGSAHALRKFKEEISLLSRLRHPNIVLYLGTVCERSARDDGVITERWRLVTEYVRRGSLYQVMRKVPPERLSWRRRLEIAIGTALGMYYLHSQGVAHLDLKSLNILIDENYKAKVCDFGLCREGMVSTHGASRNDGTQAEQDVADPVGTMEWMAPEVMRGERAKRSADVFSFGVVLWELCALEKPHKDVLQKQLLFHLVGNEGLRPKIPECTAAPWRALIERCWTEAPKDRPDFRAVIQQLRELWKKGEGGQLLIESWAVKPVDQAEVDLVEATALGLGPPGAAGGVPGAVPGDGQGEGALGARQ